MVRFIIGLIALVIALPIALAVWLALAAFGVARFVVRMPGDDKTEAHALAARVGSDVSQAAVHRWKAWKRHVCDRIRPKPSLPDPTQLSH